MRRSLLALPAALAMVGLPACAGAEAPPEVRADVRFAAQPGAGGVTYDPALVPVGAEASVISTSGGDATTVSLTVRGLLPDRAYGAHAHVNPCGATGDAAGPHFQWEVDPVSPSVDPRYANAENEVWLDLTTDAAGAGTATASIDQAFPADRRPKSVIVHAMQTATEPGKAGTAGARPACVDVAF